VARKAPRVVVYSGPSKIETRLDQNRSKGYAVGFQGLIKVLMAQLPQNEVIEDAIRKEVKWVPEVVAINLNHHRASTHCEILMNQSVSD